MMAKYTTCLIKQSYDHTQMKIYYDVFWGGQKIYTSYDKLYTITDVILNHLDEQGWDFKQAVGEKNFEELMLIFAKKSL